VDGQQARLFKKVRQGKAVLFVGAGASVSAGAPLGGKLAESIHREFLPGVSNTSEDFIEVCTRVLDTPGVDRATVEEFIRTKLDLQPSSAHKALSRYQWQAIFTTNYDDLIETAYRTAPDRRQRCDVHFGREFSRSQSDYTDVVRLFKLMGCVTGRDDHSQMALSRSDYNRKLRQRGPLFKMLFDFVKDGTLIYVGYSFKDNLARDIIEEVIEEVGADRLPWSWALLRSCDESTEALLRQRKILPLRMTFEEFLKTLDATTIDGEEPYESGATVTVNGLPIEIPQRDVTMYDRQFLFLHDQLGLKPLSGEHESAAKRRFLEGGSDPWLGVRNGWAFRRSAEPALRSLLLECLRSAREKEVPIVLLSGPAGSGKTTLARSVSYQLYKTGVPCLFLHTNKGQIDFLVVDSFARQIQTALRSEVNTPKLVPLLIILDEAAERINDLRRLTQYLISRGVASVILAVTRENEWKIAKQERPIKIAHTQMLPDKLDGAGESTGILRHFRKLNILVSAEDESNWINRIEKEYDNSFQTALYYLAEPTRPPLAQAIRSEYDRMPPLAQTAYRYVSIFYQFGIPIDLELLARSLNHSYEDFVNSVYDPASMGVIIDDEEQRNVIRFRGRSRMVCERIVEYCYPDQADWVADLSTIVGALMPQNANEIDTIRRLLILKMGPRGAMPISDVNQLSMIFERAFSAGMRDSATLHHFALLLLDREEFVQAERFLVEALAIIDDECELGHFKTESRQNLHNSMGMVCGRRGLRLQLNGNAPEAAAQFDHAMQYFRSARLGTTPSAYPYYCESFINYSRARNSIGATKLPYLAAALKSLDESDGNAPDDDKSSILEMEAKILQYIANLPNFDELIQKQTAIGNPDGDYLNVRVRLSDGSHHAAAYDILSVALSKTPNHVGCLRLAAKLHMVLFPNDWEGWFQLLQRWLRAENQPEQCGLLFDLGFAACQLGKYAEAIRHFEQLDRISTGHPRRSGIVRKVMDVKGERQLVGVVKAIHSPIEAWIRCDLIGQDVKFLPIKQKFTVTREQTVTFVLALNYRGMLAVELRSV
jgi:DNA replication protein DnaC/tetratricopeptide (TPR) repeat protein